MKTWININEWELDKAWTHWRACTFHLPSDSKEAKAHSAYKKVEEILERIKLAEGR